MDGIISGNNITRALEKGLYGLARRQEAISHNIANVDTPGFKAVNVSFEDELVRTIAKQNSLSLYVSHPLHIQSGSGQEQGITYTRANLGRNDLNSVDIDQEMIKLAETTIRYQAAARLISGKLAQLRSVASEGRR